jgi:hypothetical protein
LFEAVGAGGGEFTCKTKFPVADCPSGFVTVTFLAPAVAAVVSMRRVICVTGVVEGEPRTTMLLVGQGRTVTPPVTVAEMWFVYAGVSPTSAGGWGSKYSEPEAEVPVSVTHVLASPVQTGAETLAGVAGRGARS